jgi:prepilin-type N-terminal cleavage/methylation domain-containing protein
MLRILHSSKPGPAVGRVPRGFTMLELLVTLSVLAIVALALSAVLMTANRGKTSTTNSVESAQAATAAVELIAEDLRSAGYGADQSTSPPQPPIAYVDSIELIMSENLQPFPDPHAPPLAYNPAGSPRPRPLNGTVWQPPVKYSTGAELVRYTLDVNNDGSVNGSDMTGPGIAAARSKNPNDFVLVRQVLGDSVGNIAGLNLDKNEAVALVRKPGGTVPALYTVYLRGLTTPWNWANGPIPVAELNNIDRIVVRVTAPSSKADARGQYAETVLTTEVNTSRNIPNWGVPTYAVTGVVYNDLNANHTRDGGEPGIPGVSVRLGATYTGVTNSTGNFTVRGPAGTFALRHTPLAQYGGFDSPDSFVVTIPPATSHSFADTARHGGTAYVTAFVDQNSNSIQDTGELGQAGVAIRLDPAAKTYYTDATGSVSMFVQTGNYSLWCTAPDSMVVTSTNPLLGTMVDAGSASHVFALRVGATATVKGKVYRDNNRNGVYDAGEPGIQNVWVGVTSDGGLTILGYAKTDASGDYTIQVPINDPPHTTAYSVYLVVPNGFFPSGRTAIRPIWLTDGQILTGNNFGVVAYQIITLNASRVLSLGSANLMENDWTGNNTSHQHGDNDIVLGADAGGTDNISVWFNQYDNTPLFSPSPADPTGYTRNAANSVLSLAVDTLDANVSPFNRPDIATGTQYTVSGNLFVWFNQNSSGNQGYVETSPNKSYRTADNGDVQSVLAYDCAGGNKLDLIAGTRSTSPGNGTIEIWRADSLATPSYARDEIYPPAGLLPGGKLGEVTCMALADLDNDGKRDLVVGTKTGAYSGQLLCFKYYTKIAGSRFVYQAGQALSTAAVTSLTCLDVDVDGYLDVVVGTQNSSSAGQLLYFHNRELGLPMNLGLARKVDAPGIVTSLISADFGGGTNKDVAMGWRSSDTGYGGGVQIFYTDLGTLPGVGVDPSDGAVFNFVPALTTSNFNYGTYPSTPSPPFLPDLAAGVKASATTGALVVFIR